MRELDAHVCERDATEDRPGSVYDEVDLLSGARPQTESVGIHGEHKLPIG